MLAAAAATTTTFENIAGEKCHVGRRGYSYQYIYFVEDYKESKIGNLSKVTAVLKRTLTVNQRQKHGKTGFRIFLTY